MRGESGVNSLSGTLFMSYGFRDLCHLRCAEGYLQDTATRL
jgi:hypothetical protein